MKHTPEFELVRIGFAVNRVGSSRSTPDRMIKAERLTPKKMGTHMTFIDMRELNSAIAQENSIGG